MGPAEVQRCWPDWLAGVFADMPTLLGRATSEPPQVALYWIIGTKAFVVLSEGVSRRSGNRALWVENVAGEVERRPKANLETMGEVLADCEAIARKDNCMEVRIEPGTRTEWKARLLPRFGFEPDGPAMRKVLADG